jgi:hypothetical protein
MVGHYELNEHWYHPALETRTQQRYSRWEGAYNPTDALQGKFQSTTEPFEEVLKAKVEKRSPDIEGQIGIDPGGVAAAQIEKGIMLIIEVREEIFGAH